MKAKLFNSLGILWIKSDLTVNERQDVLQELQKEYSNRQNRMTVIFTSKDTDIKFIPFASPKRLRFLNRNK